VNPVTTPQRPATTSPVWLEGLSWILLLAACCFLLFSLIVYGLGDPIANLGFVHPLRMKPPFADLRYVTANAECGVNLDDYYKGLVVGCDPSGRTYRFDYPPMTIWLGRLLHVRGSHTPLIAITTAIAMGASIIALLRDQLAGSWKWRLLGAALFMSFPLQLIFERANIDIMVYLMILLFAFLLSRPMKKAWAEFPGNLFACLLIFLAVSLKVYPLFGIAGLVALRDKALGTANRFQWNSILSKAMILFASAAGVITLLVYFEKVGKLIKEGGMNSHGLLALGYMNLPLIDAFGIDAARLLIRFLFLAKIVSLLTGVVMAYKSNLSLPIPGSQAPARIPAFHWISIAMMSSIWLGCYLLTINHDYRFIYLLPFIVYLASLSSSPSLVGLQADWPKVLIFSILFVFLFPWWQLGYTQLGMNLIRFLEPVSEFIFIPLFAGSLFYFLISNTSFFPRVLTGFLFKP
jgi:hypothetical protein